MEKSLENELNILLENMDNQSFIRKSINLTNVPCFIKKPWIIDGEWKKFESELRMVCRIDKVNSLYSGQNIVSQNFDMTEMSKYEAVICNFIKALTFSGLTYVMKYSRFGFIPTESRDHTLILFYSMQVEGDRDVVDALINSDLGIGGSLIDNLFFIQATLNHLKNTFNFNVFDMYMALLSIFKKTLRNKSPALSIVVILTWMKFLETFTYVLFKVLFSPTELSFDIPKVKNNKKKSKKKKRCTQSVTPVIQIEAGDQKNLDSRLNDQDIYDIEPNDQALLDDEIENFRKILESDAGGPRTKLSEENLRKLKELSNLMLKK